MGPLTSRGNCSSRRRRYAAERRIRTKGHTTSASNATHLFGCIGDDARNGHSMGSRKGATDTLRRPESSKKKMGEVGVTGVTSVTKNFSVS